MPNLTTSFKFKDEKQKNAFFGNLGFSGITQVGDGLNMLIDDYNAKIVGERAKMARAHKKRTSRRGEN